MVFNQVPRLNSGQSRSSLPQSAFESLLGPQYNGMQDPARRNRGIIGAEANDQQELSNQALPEQAVVNSIVRNQRASSPPPTEDKEQCCPRKKNKGISQKQKRRRRQQEKEQPEKEEQKQKSEPQKQQGSKRERWKGEEKMETKQKSTESAQQFGLFQQSRSCQKKIEQVRCEEPTQLLPSQTANNKITCHNYRVFDQQDVKRAFQNVHGWLKSKLRATKKQPQVLEVLTIQNDNYDSFQAILLRSGPDVSYQMNLRTELRQFLLQDKLNNHQLHAAQLVLQSFKNDIQYKQLYWDLYLEKFLEEVDWHRTRIQIKDLTQELHLCQKLKFQYHHRHFKGGNRTFMTNRLDMIDKSIVTALSQHPNIPYIVVQHIHGKGKESHYDPIWGTTIQEWYTSKDRIVWAYACQSTIGWDNKTGSLQVWYANPYYIGQYNVEAYQP